MKKIILLFFIFLGIASHAQSYFNLSLQGGFRPRTSLSVIGINTIYDLMIDDTFYWTSQISYQVIPAEFYEDVMLGLASGLKLSFGDDFYGDGGYYAKISGNYVPKIKKIRGDTFGISFEYGYEIPIGIDWTGDVLALGLRYEVFENDYKSNITLVFGYGFAH